MEIRTSSKQASLTRMVILFCPPYWEGGLPAIVVHAAGVVEGVQLVNATLIPDCVRFPDLIGELENSPSRLTFGEVPLFDDLNDKQRTELQETLEAEHANRDVCWAEWPKFVPEGVKKFTPPAMKQELDIDSAPEASGTSGEPPARPGDNAAPTNEPPADPDTKPEVKPDEKPKRGSPSKNK